MRLDWIFLPRENPCAKFYIIMMIITVNTNCFPYSTLLYRVDVSYKSRRNV